MLKNIFLLLLLSFFSSAAWCQHLSHSDSLLKAAKADAKNFRLDDGVWKKYRHNLPYTSDYFKPHETNVKNAALLNDSVYVYAYRQAAVKANKHRHTVWHYVLVGGGVVASLVVVALAAILIFIAPTMG